MAIDVLSRGSDGYEANRGAFNVLLSQDPVGIVTPAGAAQVVGAVEYAQAEGLRIGAQRTGHAASFEVCAVAEVDGELAGVIAWFPVSEGDERARRFVSLTAPRVPPWRWPGLLRHLRAAGTVSPNPPARMLYVDALAVDPSFRRRGVARALLERAERAAIEHRLDGVALDTGLHNEAARALYEATGFSEREIRRAPSAHVADAIGGPGFVSYLKRL